MSYEAFIELARERRSIRKFKPDPVTDDFKPIKELEAWFNKK